MQNGKGAEAGAAFSNASQTFFGSKGTKSFLVKLTTIITILFFINCFIIGLFNNNLQSKDIVNILDEEKKVLIDDENKLNYNFEDIPVENIKK